MAESKKSSKDIALIVSMPCSAYRLTISGKSFYEITYIKVLSSIVDFLKSHVLSMNPSGSVYVGEGFIDIDDHFFSPLTDIDDHFFFSSQKRKKTVD